MYCTTVVHVFTYIVSKRILIYTILWSELYDHQRTDIVWARLINNDYECYSRQLFNNRIEQFLV